MSKNEKEMDCNNYSYVSYLCCDWSTLKNMEV